jgi:tetratricopeptide (TPR) repeat protein
MINKYAGHYENAEADYRRALEIEPQDGDTWRRLGDLHQEMSHFPDAVAAYQKAVEVQPGYFKNYEALCYLYSDQANFDEAIRQCKKAVDLVPKLSEAHYSFAKPYVAAGNYDQGESEVRTALDLDPKSSRALAALAVVLVYRHRYTEAIPKFTEAATIGPETEILYLNLGTAFRLAGLPQNAREAYTKSRRLAEAELSRNLRDRMLHSHLAYVCARLNDHDCAQFEAAAALGISNGSVEVTRVIVQTYGAMGEVGRAVKLAATLPDDSLKRLNRSPDVADISRDPRFQDLMQSRHIQ